MRVSFGFGTILLGAVLGLAACQNGDSKAEYPHNPGGADPYAQRETVFGTGGIGDIFSGSKKSPEGAVLGVNAYLWRASLDTVSFMPIASADPFGGTILTDWYASEKTPYERFKLNIFIMSSELRADGVRVSVFRQTREGKGAWHDAAVEKETATELENAILTRARALKVAQTKTS